MKQKILTILGTALLMVPLSDYILWIIASGQSNVQAERVEIFLTYFPEFIKNTKVLTLLSIAFCAMAVLATAFSRNVKGWGWNKLNLLVLVLSSVLLFLNVFSLM